MELAAGDDDGEGEGDAPQRITVGISDVIRVMPWFCIEVRTTAQLLVLCTFPPSRGKKTKRKKRGVFLATEKNIKFLICQSKENHIGVRGRVSPTCIQGLEKTVAIDEQLEYAPKKGPG